MVARRFPKAKVASSILVGGIPVPKLALCGFSLCLLGTVGGSFLDTLGAQESEKASYTILPMPLAKARGLCDEVVDSSSVERPTRETLRHC